jgi:hypothetical protein
MGYPAARSTLRSTLPRKRQRASRRLEAAIGAVFLHRFSNDATRASAGVLPLPGGQIEIEMPVSALAERPSGMHRDPLNATSPNFATRGAQEAKQILNERRMAYFDDHVPQVAPPEIAANEAPYSHYWQKRAVLYRPYSYIGPDERRRVDNISYRVDL